MVLVIVNVEKKKIKKIHMTITKRSSFSSQRYLQANGCSFNKHQAIKCFLIPLPVSSY